MPPDSSMTIQDRELIKAVLRKAEKGLTAKKIELRTHLSKSRVSQHLQFLKNSKLVDVRQEQATRPSARPGDKVYVYTLTELGLGAKQG